MKKLFFIPVIYLAISVCINAQTNQPKLNQVEQSKKLIGVWQKQTSSDTVDVFEMSYYKDAVLETVYRTVNGVKELLFTCSFAYDPKSDNFKGFLIYLNGQIQTYHFRFSSDKEVVFERVEDFKTNKLLARNKFEFPDPDHLNGAHFNRNEVQYSSSKWAKINSDGFKTTDVNTSRTDIDPGLNQLELARKFTGIWLQEGKKDTIPGLEFEQYGNTITASDIVMINGKKVARDKISFGFSKTENMFKMFFLSPSGNYSTRNAFFTSEKRFFQELTSDFNPDKISATSEMIFDAPDKITAKIFNKDGTTRIAGKLIKK